MIVLLGVEPAQCPAKTRLGTVRVGIYGPLESQCGSRAVACAVEADAQVVVAGAVARLHVHELGESVGGFFILAAFELHLSEDRVDLIEMLALLDRLGEFLNGVVAALGKVQAERPDGRLRLERRLVGRRALLLDGEPA